MNNIIIVSENKKTEDFSGDTALVHAVGVNESKAQGQIGFNQPLPHGISASTLYANIFYSYSETANQGFLSKSQWLKKERQLIPDAPKGIVVRKTQQVIGWNYYLILKHIDDKSDLVALDYYEVIHKDHTVSLFPNPIIEASPNCKKEIYKSLSSLPPLPSPSTTLLTSIDRREIDKRAVLALKSRDYEVINSREKRVINIGAFVPENFSTEDQKRLGRYLEEAYCIFHNMHLFRVRTRQPKDVWIDLHYDYCDRRFPHWRELRSLLLDGILERTEVESYPELGIVIPRGLKGHRCYGYRFAREEYRHATVRKRLITDPRLIKIIEAHKNIKYPVQRWLEKNLQQIEMVNPPDDTLWDLAMDEGDPEIRYCTYREQVELIQARSWVFVADDFSRRIHTNLTQLKRELRACLRVAGRPLVQLDIKNSQPLFIGLAAKRYGVEDVRYLDLCQQDLYQHLADRGGFTRQDVKDQLTQKALFATNGSPYQRLPVKQLFDAEFPKMARFIRDMKDEKKTTTNPKPHNALARLAQRSEANFLIYGGVCERIRREKPDCWLGTIHDSLLMLPESAEYVRGVMLEEFGRLGVRPMLEIEPCSC